MQDLTTQKSRHTIDLAIVLVLAVSAFVVASRSLAGYLAVPWLEDFLVPCTGRAGWVPEPAGVQALPQWQALLSGQIAVFPCDAVRGLPLIEIGPSWQQSEYFHRALGVWYRITGPTATAFASFQSLLFAMSTIATYGVFRLGMGRVFAIAGTAILMLSQWQLEPLKFPIEYAKAPWILATVLLCGLTIRRDLNGRPIFTTAFFAGLAAGIGSGFKPDVFAAIPLAAFTTAVFVRGMRNRTLATACVIAGVVAGGGPVLYRALTSESGSLLPVQFLGGQDSAAEAMFAESRVYDYGLMFDDSHITALLNVYGRQMAGAVEPFYFSSRQMQAVSMQLLRELWTTFPGDLVLRVIAAVIRLLRFGGLGLVAAALGMVALWTYRLRAGWYAVFVGIYLAAYVSLVFQRRHFFHLEFIGWWLAGFFVHAVWTAIRRKQQDRLDGITRRLGVAALSLLVLLAGTASLLTAARAYQGRAVVSAIEARLAASADPRTLRQTVHDGRTLLRIGGVSAEDAPSAAPDTLRGDYLSVRFDCGDAPIVSVSTVFAPGGQSWNRGVSVPCTGGESVLLMPVYQYGPGYRFEGLAMAPGEAARVRSVSVVNERTPLGAWLQLSLSSDWRTQLHYKTLLTRPIIP